jgi:hypothetical protein
VEPTPPAAFYCVSSGEYFLGAVAMVNSLRLLGHSEPIFMLDCGMSPTQRELVSAEVKVVPAPDDSQPFLLKTIAPLRHPAEVMVLIDADMIVTRSLADLIERASEGRAVAVEDRLDRFVPEWGELLGMGTAHRRPYISSSLVFLGGSFGRRVITDVGEALSRIDMRGTAYSGPERGFHFESGTFEIAAMEHPWCFADQDVLNAVLSVEAAREQLQTLDPRLTAATPFTGVSVLDEQTLRCAYEDGTEPYVLHHVFPVKPWHAPTIPGVYSQLLTRLLHGDDVAVRVPNRELPPHLRSGLLAAARNWRRGGFSARARAFRDRFRREPAPGALEDND